MTSVPPPRRRPVPTTPTTRPRVAGLRKRPEPTAAPDAEANGVDTGAAPAEDTRPEGEAAEPTAADRAETLPSDRDVMRPAEVTGLIEPREDDQDDEDEATEPAPRPRPTGRRKRTGEAVAPSVLTEPDARHSKSESDESAARDDEPEDRSTRLGGS